MNINTGIYLDSNALKEEANELLAACAVMRAEATYIGAKRARDDAAASETGFEVPAGGGGGGSTQCCLLYTSPSPRDQRGSRMPSSA